MLEMYCQTNERKNLVDLGEFCSCCYWSDSIAMVSATMINNRFQAPNGIVYVELHCGCCGMFFDTPVGGTIFCKACREGEHPECKVMDIMGIKK